MVSLNSVLSVESSRNHARTFLAAMGDLNDGAWRGARRVHAGDQRDGGGAQSNTDAIHHANADGQRDAHGQPDRDANAERHPHADHHTDANHHPNGYEHAAADADPLRHDRLSQRSVGVR